MNCGECLINEVLIVELRADGICPECGADYSNVIQQEATEASNRGEEDSSKGSEEENAGAYGTADALPKQGS